MCIYTYHWLVTMLTLNTPHLLCIKSNLLDFGEGLVAASGGVVSARELSVCESRISSEGSNDIPCPKRRRKGVVGAMDGTLIPAWVSVDRQHIFRSRKATISQNVLAICDFNLNFTYVYAGWEGSASDANVLFNAINNDENFPWPPREGKYYLVDAGYTNYGPFLAPYRATRYFGGAGFMRVRKKNFSITGTHV